MLRSSHPSGWLFAYLTEVMYAEVYTNRKERKMTAAEQVMWYVMWHSIGAFIGLVIVAILVFLYEKCAERRDRKRAKKEHEEMEAFFRELDRKRNRRGGNSRENGWV